MVELIEVKNGVLEFTEKKLKISTNSNRKVGLDASGIPEYQMWNELQQKGNFVSFSSPVETHYSKDYYWCDALKSPKGHFATFVAPVDAFKEGWKYTSYDNIQIPIDEDMNIQLKRIAKIYKIKAYHTLAVITARALGKSLIVKLPRKNQVIGKRRKPGLFLRVLPIGDENIFYNEDGEPDYYLVTVQWGRGSKILKIPAEDGVLYINREDPFGNRFQGIPTLYANHNDLTWEANRKKGWATAMDCRGISMMQLKIPGFELEDKNKWESAYGNPSVYSVMFTDEKTEVVPIPGVQSSYDPQKDGDATTKEVSAGTGFAMSRIDGTQRGQVSGAQTDIDNYYSMLTSMKEDYEPQLIELHEILFPPCVECFDISWEIEPSMDATKKAQVLATIINAAQVAQDYMSFNQVLNMLDLPTVPDGDIPASVYIYNQKMAAGMLGMEEGGTESSSGGIVDGEEEEEEDVDREKQKRSYTETPFTMRRTQRGISGDMNEKRGGDRSGKPHSVQQCNKRFKNGERCKNRTVDLSGYCYLHRGSSHTSTDSDVNSTLKRKIGELKDIKTIKMLISGDSYRIINDELRKNFGSGMSTFDIAQIKESLSSIERDFTKKGKKIGLDGNKVNFNDLSSIITSFDDKELPIVNNKMTMLEKEDSERDRTSIILNAFVEAYEEKMDKKLGV